MNKIGIWAYRWSVARGWQWFLEHRCGDSDKEDWLNVCQNDEPNIIFKLSYDQPINKPETLL